MTPARHDPQLALRTLDRHGVAFVLIGGLAGRAAGSPSITNDTEDAARVLQAPVYRPRTGEWVMKAAGFG